MSSERRGHGQARRTGGRAGRGQPHAPRASALPDHGRARGFMNSPTREAGKSRTDRTKAGDGGPVCGQRRPRPVGVTPDPPLLMAAWSPGFTRRLLTAAGARVASYVPQGSTPSTNVNSDPGQHWEERGSRETQASEPEREQKKQAERSIRIHGKYRHFRHDPGGPGTSKVHGHCRKSRSASDIRLRPPRRARGWI